MPSKENHSKASRFGYRRKLAFVLLVLCFWVATPFSSHGWHRVVQTKGIRNNDWAISCEKESVVTKKNRTTRWNENYEKLCLFRSEHGHANVPSSYGDVKLARFVTRQRTAYRKRQTSKSKRMTDERIKRLEKIGFEWDIKEARWEKWFSELKEFKDKHQHCNVPLAYIDNPGLGRWVNKLRNNYRKSQSSDQRGSSLEGERIKRLNEIGFEWDPNEARWEKRFSELLEFKEKHNHCDVPQVYEENPELGIWINTIRTKYKELQASGQKKSGSLTEERIKRLENIGIEWNPNEEKWEQRFSMLEEFRKKYNHCNVPSRYEGSTELGVWVNNVRKSYKHFHSGHKGGVLTEERIKRLDGMGFEWDPLGARWEKRFAELKEFKAKHNHCDVPSVYKDNPELGIWTTYLWTSYSKFKSSGQKGGWLTEERMNQLEEIGFELDALENRWEQRFLELVQFKKKHGHCDVPWGYEDSPKLGRWVNRLRWNYEEVQFSQEPGWLTVEKIKRLEKIGFEWKGIFGMNP